MTTPLNEGAALQLTRSDGVAADGAQNTGVGQLGLSRDDAVGNVVVDGLVPCVSPLYHLVCSSARPMTYAVLLLLDLNDTSVLESPPDHIGVLAGALDDLRGLERGPELVKVLELDVVPHVGEGSLDDGALQHGGRGGNSCARHDDW